LTLRRASSKSPFCKMPFSKLLLRHPHVNAQYLSPSQDPRLLCLPGVAALLIKKKIARSRATGNCNCKLTVVLPQLLFLTNPNCSD
jgi:hypothetical protein